MRSLRWMVLLAALGWPAVVQAKPKPVLSLPDPQGDDHGPGNYIYPSDSSAYPRRSFDLTQLDIAVDGDTVIFTVKFARKIVRPFVAKRTNATEIRLNNGLYVQNVDIYIDSMPGRGVGFTKAIPGRNITIDEKSAWDVAVVITPQPNQARSMLMDWAPGRKVVFAKGARSVGSRVIARVDMADLGGLPERSWGYQAVVTGALWEPSFNVVNRFLQDRGINVFTMPVHTVPEDQAFGGGRLDYAHPFVLDLLVPKGATQSGILTSYDAEGGTLAVVPMVYPDPAAYRATLQKLEKTTLTLTRPPPDSSASRWMNLPVKDVQGDMIVLARSGEDLEPYRLGEILDGTGRFKCRAVVASVHEGFVVVTSVNCKIPVDRGDHARFDTLGSKD